PCPHRCNVSVTSGEDGPTAGLAEKLPMAVARGLTFHRTRPAQAPGLDRALQHQPTQPISSLQNSKPIPPRPMPISSLINTSSCPTSKGALQRITHHGAESEERHLPIPNGS